MKRLLKTRFAWALLTFCLMGTIAGSCGLFKSAPEDFSFLSWTGWTIRDFLRQERHPDIVFLGSSLMLVPLDGMDADYLGSRVDGSQHHHSCYFEDKFKELTGIKLRTFTFALPGEMPSDAYLIVKNLLNGPKKPELIVYGVGPRDFLDNMLPSPAATDPYRFLSRFGDIEPIKERLMPDWQQRLDYELGKLSYFYGQRGEISKAAEKIASRILNKVEPLPLECKALSFDERHVILPDFRPCEILEGQAWFRPSTGSQEGNFVDNLAEYRKRYATMKWDTYISQLRFFADTLDEARRKGIKVVVVTMPITDLNRTLLNDQSWSAYRSGVIGMSRRKGATVLDFSESMDFSRSDFSDTVHLHSAGGKKLFDMIMDRLSENSQVLAALQTRQESDSKIANFKDVNKAKEERESRQSFSNRIAEKGGRL